MIQDTLFHESIDDALKSIVQHAGGPKKVGLLLRPTKSADAAGKWLSDCLNSSRQERFDPDDVVALLRLGRERGYHEAKHWLDAETGYAPTPPMDPADQQAELMREYIESVRQQQELAARLERIVQPTVARARR